MANGCRQLLDGDLRALGNLHQSQLRRRHLADEIASEYGVWVRVRLTEPIERRLFCAGGIHHEHPFGWRDGRETAGPLNRTRARSLERVVATGVEDEDRDASPACLQTVDNAFHAKRRVAHELLLPFGGRGDVGGEKVVLPMDFEAMTSEEEQRRVTELYCPVEGQKRLPH